MFKKYPFVRQEGYKDCGCACLQMILKYYKGNLSLERLRELSKTSKNGTTAYNIIKCANEIGFSSYGVKGEIENLNEVVLPCIAHVIIDNLYKHYIVIYNVNYDKKFLLIADPDKGIKKISFDDFNKIWTGVLIILFPIRSLPITKNISIFNFLFHKIFIYKKNIMFIFWLSLFVIIIKLVSSFYFKFLIEGIELSKGYLKSIFIIFCSLELTKLIINYLRNRILIILNCKIDFSLTLDAFKQIILLPYHYYHNRTTGEVISKINDLGNVRDVISKIIVSLFIDIPLLVISIIFLVNINLKLFIIALGIFVFYILLSLIYNHIFKTYINKIKEKQEIVNSYMYESISGFETVKGIHVEDKIINRFNYKYTLLLNDIFRLQNHVNNQGFIKDLINDVGNIFILFFGCLLVFDGKIDFGYLLTFSSMMAYFLEPIRNLIDLDVDIKDSREAINRILSLYESCEEKGIVEFKNGGIRFNNLNYSYDDVNYILKNVSFSINKGEKIMIYGSSGSGKSTLLKLLMRYYEIDRGMIYIGDNDINDINLSDLRQNITYISQNEVLFNGTILDNLKYYNECDNDDVINMTKLVEFNEILDNKLGLNLLVEENGFNFSGGQRQRIVLARSMLKNSDIILIDEGLNQIDVSLERKILTNIFNKYQDKTIIIISHRLDNLDLYDRLFKVSDGKVIEDRCNEC